VDFCRCLRGTGSLKDAIKKVDCGWKKVFVKIYTQGGFPLATRHQYINSFFLPPFSPPTPPTFNFSIIYSSEIPHIPPPLAIRNNLMRTTSSPEIFLSFNCFEQIEKAHNKEPTPGGNLWHWHASATPCVSTVTRCQ
jgi:hypothetical protein